MYTFWLLLFWEIVPLHIQRSDTLQSWLHYIAIFFHDSIILRKDRHMSKVLPLVGLSQPVVLTWEFEIGMQEWQWASGGIGTGKQCKVFRKSYFNHEEVGLEKDVHTWGEKQKWENRRRFGSEDWRRARQRKEPPWFELAFLVLSFSVSWLQD